MSITTVADAVSRIKRAERKSPIAAFIVPNGAYGPSLETVFANTVRVEQRIRAFDPLFIGVYHRFGDLIDIRNQLNEALEEAS